MDTVQTEKTQEQADAEVAAYQIAQKEKEITLPTNIVQSKKFIMELIRKLKVELDETFVMQKELITPELVTRIANMILTTSNDKR